VHYQNEPHWDPYLAAVEGGRLPIQRGLVPTRRELLVRELILQLKRGWLDTERLHAKFGIDPLVEWAEVWSRLRAAGHLEPAGARPVLTRQGLLQVDSLLPAFFAEPAITR